MRDPRALLGLLLLFGCGDDDAVLDGSMDGVGSDGAPGDGGVDAVPLCTAVPDGGGPPTLTTGNGWAWGALGTAAMLAGVSRASDGALVLGGRLSPPPGQTSATSTWGGTTVTVTGDEAFVARISASGTPTWIRATSGTGAVAPGFHSSASGDGVAIGGGFDGTLTVNPLEGSPVSLTTVAARAPFVARYSAAGNLVWAKTGTASMSAQTAAVRGLADGQVWACGSFTGTLVLGPGEALQTSLTADGRDLWLGRFGASGALAWAARAGGSGDDGCRAVAVNADGSSVTGGEEAGRIVLRLWSAGGAPAGDVQITGAAVEVTDLVAYEGGGFAVAGLFADAVQFEDDGVVFATLPALGSSAFVARYQANGTLVWARQVTRPVNGLAVRADGSLWGVGTVFRQQAVLNECEPDRLQLDYFDDEAFLARWDAGGRLTYAGAFGEYGSQFGVSVADVPGGAAVAGAYIYYARFYPTASQVMLANSDNPSAQLFVLGVTAP